MHPIQLGLLITFSLSLFFIIYNTVIVIRKKKNKLAREKAKWPVITSWFHLASFLVLFCGVIFIINLRDIKETEDFRLLIFAIVYAICNFTYLMNFTEELTETAFDEGMYALGSMITGLGTIAGIITAVFFFIKFLII